MSIPSGFELHKRQYRGQNRLENVVSLTVSGFIALSLEVHELLGKADKVEFLFDHDRKVLALRAAPVGSMAAYKVRKPLKSGSTNVFAKPIYEEYGIELSEPVHIVPWVEDDLVCIHVGNLIGGSDG